MDSNLADPLHKNKEVTSSSIQKEETREIKTAIVLDVDSEIKSNFHT